METFAEMLRRARRNACDPQRGGPLSQERFAELLGQQLGVPRIVAATVSNWERAICQPRSYDREMLTTIVTVLLGCGGLIDLADGNTLLTCGGYAPLSEEETRRLGEAPTKMIALGEGNRTQVVAANTYRAADIAAEQLDSQHVRSPFSETVLYSDDVVDSTTKAVQAGTLIAIRHQSMEAIPKKALIGSLPDEYRHHRVIELVVDQCDLFQANRLTDPREAARRQAGLETWVTELLTHYPDARVAYYGIAHIPLVFLAGFCLSNRRQMALFEFNRLHRTWDQLQLQKEAPRLILSGLPSRVKRARGEVVVRVSINHRVALEAVTEVIPSPIASIHLELEQPQIDVVTSERQLRGYGQAFRQTMDRIHALLPGATGIHVFYAGPQSLAFYCAQQVSKTIHPRIVVYNYLGQDVPKYSWGLDITREIDAADFLVWPGYTAGKRSDAL